MTEEIDDPIEANIAAVETTLNEIAAAINELREAGAHGKVCLDPEWKTLQRLIQERAELGRFSYEEMFGVAAKLVLQGMVAQSRRQPRARGTTAGRDK